jgi:hypothetical protein
MVSGRCDEYSSNVMQSSFCSFSVRHFPWTENNAARQLVPRQGVGRTRHLCGRILRIQQAVFFWRRCRFPPWGNTVTLAHIGTKCLPRGRLFFFFLTFSRWTSVDPATLEMIGQEGHAMVTLAAEAANPETCQVFSGHSHVEFFWIWVALGIHSLGCV